MRRTYCAARADNIFIEVEEEHLVATFEIIPKSPAASQLRSAAYGRSCVALIKRAVPSSLRCELRAFFFES